MSIRLYWGVFLFFQCTILLSCSDDLVEVQGSSFEAPYVNGYYPRSRDGYQLGPAVGAPNVKTASENFRIISYPNPAVQDIAVEFSDYSKLKKVWLVPAVSHIGQVQSINYFNSSLLQVTTPVLSTSTSSSNIHLEVQDLEKGFYRLYVEIEGELMWDNILVTDIAPY